MKQLSKSECIEFAHLAGSVAYEYIVPSELTASNMRTLLKLAGVTPPLLFGRKEFITKVAEIYGAYIVSMAFFAPISCMNEQARNGVVDWASAAFVEDAVCEELEKFKSLIYLDKVRSKMIWARAQLNLTLSDPEETLLDLTASMGLYTIQGIRDLAIMKNLSVSAVSEVDALIVAKLFSNYLEHTLKLLATV